VQNVERFCRVQSREFIRRARPIRAGISTDRRAAQKMNRDAVNVLRFDPVRTSARDDDDAMSFPRQATAQRLDVILHPAG
jgi:hypothetical protein